MYQRTQFFKCLDVIIRPLTVVLARVFSVKECCINHGGSARLVQLRSKNAVRFCGLHKSSALVNVVFLVDYAQHIATAQQRTGLRFQTICYGVRNAVERDLWEKRTFSFSNSFSHVEPKTGETLLRSFAVWWNSLT